VSINVRAAAPAAGEEPDEYATALVSDPLESVNRAIFKFNDGFYTHLLRPFARGYERVVPSPVRRGLGNFFDNIKFPVRFASCVLQAKAGRAARETGKFVLNSTVGVGGLVRVSDNVPALRAVPAEDIGLTLGVWGFGSGPYLVLPFLGPSSIRDTVGLAGNAVLNPVNWSATKGEIKGYNLTWRWGTQALDFANSSPDMLRTYDSFKRAALDPYVSVRNGYLQYRDAAVKK
jgi:phospholipid-binding lipoprotein MlaA